MDDDIISAREFSLAKEVLAKTIMALVKMH